MMRARPGRFLAICILGAAWFTLAQTGAAVAHRRPASRARPTQACAGADTPVGAASPAMLRAAVLCLINQQRTAHGLPGLQGSARLNRAAQGHTQAMVATGIFGHGANFALGISTSGYDWRAVGQNIASGYATPRAVVSGWMASTPHCRNILDPSYRDAGTGVATQSVGADVGPGTWTEDFGLLMRASPASRNTGPQGGCPY